MNSGLILIAVCYLCSATLSLPLQNGMMFYQPAYYDVNQRSRAYQQAMLLHYGQQPFYGRSSGAGMSAFATGDSVAAGTYLRENKLHREHASASEQQDTYENTDEVQAIAEAYPEEPAANDEIIQLQDEQLNEVLPQKDSIPVVEQSEPADSLPFDKDNTPLAPLPTTKPNKVHVELDSSAVAESDEDDDDVLPFLPPKKNRKSNGDAPPPYSFFPNIFSDASGSTIAIANAFSNGKAAARSHAIAYGSRASSKRRSNNKRIANVE